MKHPIRHVPAFEAAFLAVVVAAYVSIFTNAKYEPTLTEWLILVGLGIIFTLVGVQSFAFFEKHEAFLARLAYFSFTVLLAALIIFFSRGAGALVVLPLAGESVGLFSWRGVIIACLVLMAILVAVFLYYANEPLRVIEYAINVGAGMVFVIAFTLVMVREARARIEIERLLKELGEANAKLREYSSQVEELATAKERNRVAREIHDSLGHYFTAVNMQIEAARAVMTSDQDKARDSLQKAQSLTKEGLAEVWRSVAALRASPLETRTLAEAVTTLIEESRAAGIVTNFNTAGESRILSPQAELTLFRAAQEGLTNVRKHAYASRADLTLDYTRPDRVKLEVKDNGRGRQPDGGGGFGLLGLSERVQLLDGNLKIQTGPGQGFVLEVELPG
jgi:signal transduction histidine kinase